MVYIEYYVIENLVINYIIISCTSILTKRYNPKKNKLLGASLGGAYSVAYLYPSMNILFTVPFKIIIMSIITLISFRSKSKKDYVHVALVFYLVNIFISGSTYFIIYFTGISHLKISFLIACTYVSCELLKYIYKDLKMLKYIKELTKTINI
ncbi:TPA: sigma-E processing peptidase SpoIIGA, partial [Clostridioides difficile]